MQPASLTVQKRGTGKGLEKQGWTEGALEDCPKGSQLSCLPPELQPVGLSLAHPGRGG